MTIDDPVELKVFVVIAERVDELLGNFQQSHVEEVLNDGECRNVEVELELPVDDWIVGLHVLAAEQRRREKGVRGQRDDLSVH